ncbi:related to GPI-anchor transamidase complex subunit Gpi16 [Ustilago trichophora]|uniref:Related to GPI-anchor transamidase complex subunit Gpi16 n=1 Tax=Ustilago trichophora TaxID=86804 RepID=A0A5C3E7N5_9BASI|nr:related to GPI-anchor transamidase complex subunit Gpi16 [Ustilago trichophora]
MKASIRAEDVAASPSSSPSKPRRNPKNRTLLSTLVPLILAALLLLVPSPTRATSDNFEQYDPPSGFFPSESFTETLLLKPLPDGRVLSSFDFTLTSTSSSTSNFRLLPRSLLQPIQHFGVSEVHLSLNSGKWRYGSWGSPVTTLQQRSGYEEANRQQDMVVFGDRTATNGKNSKVRLGEESVATGAELLARFEENSTTGDRWKGLTSALAGLFCTSLDTLDERQTVQPHHAYSSPRTTSNTTYKTLHALLPTEGVCTENLTPFLKLLPCKNSAGLSTLLNPLALFSANFQGLAVHVKRLPPPPSYAIQGEEDSGGGWEVKLTFTAVFAPAVTRDVSVRDWSMSSLFGRPLDSACPLADESLVRVLKPNDPEGSAKYEVDPLPRYPACSKPGQTWNCRHPGSGKLFPVLEEQDEVTDELAHSGLLAWESEQEEAEYEARLQKRWAHYLDSVDGEYLYDVCGTFAGQGMSKGKGKEAFRDTNLPIQKGGAKLDIKMSWPHETRFSYPAHNVTSQAIHVDRALIGSGQERTTLQVELTNADQRVAQPVLWYETLGYFVKPYLHTLKHSIEFLPPTSTNLTDEDELLRGVADFENPIESLIYQPTTAKRGSRRPFVLEGVVRIPARSKVVLTMELRKTFVPYSQHPPDAHRGFDLSPAIVFPLAPVDPREALLAARKRATASSRTGGITAPEASHGLLASLVHLLKRFTGTEASASNQAGQKARPRETSKTQTRIYTLPRLVELATPDFSFVYTNIIFTSTVVALFFGSTLNTLLRTFTDIVI